MWRRKSLGLLSHHTADIIVSTYCWQTFESTERVLCKVKEVISLPSEFCFPSGNWNIGESMCLVPCIVIQVQFLVLTILMKKQSREKYTLNN